MTVVYVALGGAIGSVLRYLFGVMSGKLWPLSAFPYATLIVNVAGSFAMGILIGVLARFVPEHQNAIRSFVAIGVLGGFTTFSTFSLDVVSLFEKGQQGMAIAYIIASVVLSVLALVLGLILMRGGITQ